MKRIWILSLVLFISIVSLDAQTKRRSRPKSSVKKTSAQTVRVVETTSETATPASVPAKKNERAEVTMPIESSESVVPAKKNAPTSSSAANKANSTAATAQLPFNYEFSQPKFYITRVLIEHDAAGSGKITFQKQDLADSLTDPLTISAKAWEKMQELWKMLDLIESTENYQSQARNYAHLGTMKLRRRQDNMVREAEFNWTENQTAKDLTDEYKKLTEQYVWIFDMNLARENQPLNAPQLVDRLESLFNRNQLSDSQQMLPFLREAADDERIPLLARNHLSKIIVRIEKIKEEK